MKEHAKRALKHDTKVLGKTVPTMLIIGLFLIGGGSAALLSTFGTVTGEADVDQAVELQSSSPFSFNGDQTAGETIIETRTIESNANVTTEIGLETTCSNTSKSNTKTGNYIDWGSDSGCTGIDTKYVEYFDSAGADFSDYSSPTEDSADGAGDDIVTVDDDADSDFDSISSAIGDSNVDSGDTVLVAPGDYDSFTVDKDVTVVSEVAPNATETASVSAPDQGTGILVSGAGATVKGFEVTADTGSDNGGTTDNGRGIDVQASDVTVTSNYIRDVRTNDRPIGILVYGDAVTDGAMTGVVVENNLVENIDATEIEGSGGSRVRGIALEGGETYDEDKSSAPADGIEITGNTVRDVGGNGKAALASGVRVYDGAKNFSIDSNVIGSVDHKVSENAPYDLGVYVTGYGSNGYGSNAIVTKNNFVSTDSNQVDVGTLNSNEALNASDNWFGTNGIQAGSVVDASWKNKTDTSIEAETTDEFGIVNEFAINLVPETYDLTTSITPAGAEETPS